MAARHLFCLVCSTPITTEEQVDACPNCGDADGTPADLDTAFPLVTTHEELRLLLLWANGYLNAIGAQHGDEPAALVTVKAGRGIISRYSTQAAQAAARQEADAPQGLTRIAEEALARGEQVLSTTATTSILSLSAE